MDFCDARGHHTEFTVHTQTVNRAQTSRTYMVFLATVLSLTMGLHDVNIADRHLFR